MKKILRKKKKVRNKEKMEIGKLGHRGEMTGLSEGKRGERVKEWRGKEGRYE